MIIAAAWLLLLAFPFTFGDINITRLLLCAVALCLFDWRKKPLALPGLLAVLWLAWAAVGVWYSPWRDLAFYGHYMRCEGLIEWLTVFLLAMAASQLSPDWWTTATVEMGALLTVLVASGCELLGFHLWAPNAIAALMAVCGVVLYSSARPSVVLVIPVMIQSQSRAGVLAVLAGAACWELFQNHSRKAWKWIAALCLAFVLIVEFSPLKHKIASFDSSKIGLGARCHWVKEGSALVYERPLTGWGLDTGSSLLTEAPVAYRHQNATTDRIHFLPLDMAMQTGFVGLFLECLAFGAAVGIARASGDTGNQACAAACAAWITFSIMNPAGLPATAFMLACLFSIHQPPPCKKSFE